MAVNLDLSEEASSPEVKNTNNSRFGLNRFGWLGDSSEESQTTPQFGCSCPACCADTPDFTHLVSDVSLSDADSPDLIKNVKKSGDIRIDSLIRQYKWANTTGTTDTKITYSFYDDANRGSYYGTKEKQVKEISEKMKNYIRDILENQIESVINVDFIEVEDSNKSYGKIRFMFSNGPSSAYTKSMSNGFDKKTGVWNGSSLPGDIHFNPKIKKDIEEGPGAYRYETLIHEIGHALGLKHSGNYNSSSNGGQDGPFLEDKYDNSANTIMSYNRLKELNPDKGATSLMPNDILALQYLYGAKEHEAGDTTYKFESVYGYYIGNDFFGSKTRESKHTIWNSGGENTFDFSGLALDNSGYHLDMNDGGWITTKDAYESTSYKARGNGKTYKTTAFGTKTAFGVTIKNLVASKSSDYIIANEAANIFSGYKSGTKAGDDTIIKWDDKDKLLLSGYKSSDVTQTKNGNNLVLGLGTDGTVTLKDYYAVSIDKRLKIHLDGSIFPSNKPTEPPVEPSNPPTEPPVEPSNPPTETPNLYLSLRSKGKADGLTFANEDIVKFNGSDFSMHFDGSDVGLSNFELDALDIISENKILMSFTKAGNIPDLGYVDDSDVILFTATKLGDQTSGTFELYLDGSDMGLNGNGEDIDAIHRLPDGRLLVSTNGSASLPGASVKDEDLLVFTPKELGDNTSGSWEKYFDGSDIELRSSGEDINAVTVDEDSNIYLSTVGNFSAKGVSAADEDVVSLTPSSLGSTTSLSMAPELFFNGSDFGLGRNDIGAIDLQA